VFKNLSRGAKPAQKARRVDVTDTAQQKTAAEKLSLLPFVLMAAMAIVAIVVKESDGGGPKCSSPEFAYAWSEVLMKERLKSPASADFPAVAQKINDLGGCRFYIRSYVDSQNSFGAMLRTRYGATLQCKGDTCTLESLNTW
jgi:hypothetical protein